MFVIIDYFYCQITDHGAVQVPEEKYDQLVLLRAQGQRVRALPSRQPLQRKFHFPVVTSY